ncbi:DNA polymerase delta subunit 2 [Portunus trituberculatus]|uniref:DNA polymerase delta subunit 2 n=1 Tax=Portunus trituberculatus TaxID=210409 RepID=A0A5B7EGW9_PORTR|nr:DNA polymerase delta subunit 2 [Portunus trituberculatus]
MNLKGARSVEKAEELLSVPKKLEIEKVERMKATYSNLSNRFKVWGKKDMSRQYCLIYGARLEKMRPLVLSKAVERWGSEVKVKRLHDLAGDGEGEKCIIIGTLYKKQELKPSILKEISEEGKSGLGQQKLLSKKGHSDASSQSPKILALIRENGLMHLSKKLVRL